MNNCFGVMDASSISGTTFTDHCSYQKFTVYPSSDRICKMSVLNQVFLCINKLASAVGLLGALEFTRESPEKKPIIYIVYIEVGPTFNVS